MSDDRYDLDKLGTVLVIQNELLYRKVTIR